MSASNASTRPVLRFRSQTGFERVFDIAPSGTRIGSRADADIRVGIPGIPAQACIIRHDTAHLKLHEVASNAVRVDGEQPNEGDTLEHGSILTIGPAQFTIELY